MTAKIEFFPVDNGDMTLITLESGRQILIDIHIREENTEKGIPDVAEMLRSRLTRDEEKRLYVDAFLLTHPDEDHIKGLSKYFHLGPLLDWDDEEDKIVIKEMWSSPIVFRRRSQNITLCEDANSWWAEARRRVKAFREGTGALEGNRILVLGDDIGTKTDGLDSIRVKPGNSFDTVNGFIDDSVNVDLYGPISPQEDEEIEDALEKNRSSVITRFHLFVKGKEEPIVFLTGGDAEVFIWERIWDTYKDTPEKLSYDILQAPHHCSWHSLSYDSWSGMGENVKVSEDARQSFEQAKSKAKIVASCKPIKDEDQDPPCIRAEREYNDILSKVGGTFYCTSTHQGKDKPLEVLLFKFESDDMGGGSKGPGTPPRSPRENLLPPTKELDRNQSGRYA